MRTRWPVSPWRLAGADLRYEEKLPMSRREGMNRT
jgi:hypothetical protein